MTDRDSLESIRAARIPRSGLASLAHLRRLASVRVLESEDDVWLFWEGELPPIVNAILAIAGATLYRPTEAGWTALGRSVPEFALERHPDLPRLDRAVIPEPIEPVSPGEFQGSRMLVTLVPCGKPRPATALRCPIESLAEWSDRAATAEIEAVQGASHGGQVWLRGRLPALPNAERYWGERVLVPLGWRPQPEWPEAALLRTAIVDDDELLVLTHGSVEAISAGAFRPLSRISVRRQLQICAD